MTKSKTQQTMQFLLLTAYGISDRIHEKKTFTCHLNTDRKSSLFDCLLETKKDTVDVKWTFQHL